MTPGQQLEATMFAALLGVHGEPLTMVRASVEGPVTHSFHGLVRRPELMSDEDKRTVNFTLREASIVQLPGNAISPGISVGEALLDTAGKSHRVQKILPAPGFVKLVCKVA